MQKLLLVFLAASLYSGVWARTYYVSPGGRDGGPGTETAPLRTVQNAVNAMRVGDSVILLSGVYSERVVVTNSGSAGTPLVIRGMPGSVIDGKNADVPGTNGLLELSGTRSVVITGVTLVNSGGAGILAVQAAHLTVRGVTVSNTFSSGIGVRDSRNIRIESNEIILTCNGGAQEFLTVSGTDNFQVLNNRVRGGSPAGDKSGEGIFAGNGSRNGKIWGNTVRDIPKKIGIYIDARDKRTYNLEISGNTVTRCVTGFALASESGGLLENVRLFNNLAHDNATCGIVIAGWGRPARRRPMKNIGIYHNTFHRNGRDWGVGIAVANRDAQGVSVINNIFSDNSYAPVEWEEGVPRDNYHFSHNIFFGPGAESEKNPGAFSLTEDPLFRDPDNGDFRLENSSPAVDRGLPVSFIVTDHAGRKRPQGKRPDMGAFESGQ